MKSNTKKPTRFIPVVLSGGITAKIDPNSIKDWKVHHGKTAEGTQVNSLNTKVIGDSIILRSGENGLPFSVNKNDYEVASIQNLQNLNYKVTPPPTDS